MLKHSPLRTLAIAAVVAIAAATAHSDNSFSWPEKKIQAAVCLTYDDSLASQLDVAYPQLEAAGLHGTFFLQGDAATMRNRLDEWRQVAESGHEIGSHTLFHPCRRGIPGRDWVAKDNDMDHYTLGQISRELDVTNSLLHAIDGHSDRTFAYPCGDTVVEEGKSSFIEINQKKFAAARGVAGGLDPIDHISFYNTRTFNAADKSAADIIAYIEDAAEQGTLAVIMFHGVGGDYLTCTGEEHEKLLAFLAENQDRIWTAPYLEVMDHIRSEYTRLGWPIN